MTDLEIQQQADNYAKECLDGVDFTGREQTKEPFARIIRGAWIDSAKWMQEQDKWIEIKSKDDLPKKENYGLYHVITKEVKYCDEPQNQGIEEYWANDVVKDKWWLDNVICYQPIIKPSPPKTK